MRFLRSNNAGEPGYFPFGHFTIQVWCSGSLLLLSVTGCRLCSLRLPVWVAVYCTVALGWVGCLTSRLFSTECSINDAGLVRLRTDART
jgi:hypothetical protein